MIHELHNNWRRIGDDVTRRSVYIDRIEDERFVPRRTNFVIDAPSRLALIKTNYARERVWKERISTRNKRELSTKQNGGLRLSNAILIYFCVSFVKTFAASLNDDVKNECL